MYAIRSYYGERALVKHSQLGVVVPELEENIRKTMIHQLPELLLEVV